jgi:hypothetical protein
MRKFVLAGVALFFAVGITLAVEVTFVKYDKDTKELTVKDKDDKEATYKITDDTKFKTKDKDGNEMDMPHERGIARLERMKEGSKARFDIDVDKDKKQVKSLTMTGGRKKG